MITLDLETLNAEQLAKLYLLLLSGPEAPCRQYENAVKVYEAGVRNCSEAEFAAEINAIHQIA